MSLQIWLPFDGQLRNQGVLYTPTPSTSVTYATGGKVTSQCLKSSTKVKYDVSKGNISTRCMTVSFWGKGDNYTGTSTAWWQVCTFNCNDNSAFHIYCVPNGRYKMEYKPELNTYCDTSKWHHITHVLDGTKLTTYVDGVQSASANVTNDDRLLTSITIGCNTVRINDFRLYNHCLSPREIQHISQGLILHLPLKDGNMEGTTNILPYPTPTSTPSYAWDSKLHPGAILVASWGGGYNSGVSSPETGYHAYWKLVDGIPTMVFPDQNSALSLGHRWLGISTGNLQTKLGANTTYTISFDARADVDGMKVNAGYHYRLTSGSSNSFHDGYYYATLTTSWKRYSKTFTTKSDMNTSIGSSLYVYGHNGSVSGTAYVRNIQIELKDHATPYTRTTRTASVMDCSGYNRHGTTVGTVKTVADSARYGACVYQGDGRTNYLKSGTFTMPTDQVTMSCWFKSSATGYSSYHIPLSFNAERYEFSVDSSGHFRNGFHVNGTRQALTTSHTSILDGKWHMLTATYDGTTIRRYVDGKELTSYATAIAGTLTGGSSQLLVGNYNGTTYGNKEAYTSDVRIYATALSAAAIKNLYEARVTMTARNDFMAYEMIEDSPANIKMTESGLARAGSISETSTTFGMPVKSLEDGSVWARIYWLNLTTDKTVFASNAEVDECLNKANRFSRMGVVDRFIGKRFSITNLMPAVSADNYTGGTADSTYKRHNTASLKVLGVATTNESFLYTANALPYTPGHTYYGRAEILQETVQGSCDLYWKAAEPRIIPGKKATTAKTWATVSGVRTASQVITTAGADWASGDYKARWDYNNSKTEGAMWFNGMMLIDLTETFGAGKEPTAAWCDEHIPYFVGTQTIEIDDDTVGWYEFMLTYPSASATSYNRWKQTSSPNVAYGNHTGFVKITTGWSKHFNAITKITNSSHAGSAVYAMNSAGNWWAPIGQKALDSSTGMPAANGSTETETELWVRIDTLPHEKRISMFDNKFIQAFNIYEL